MTQHRTNQSIREELDVEEGCLAKFIKRQKLKFFGHIKRHEGLGKLMLEGMVNGKRERGRPTKRWGKDVQELLDLTITQVGRMATDRESCRRAVWGAT